MEFLDRACSAVHIDLYARVVELVLR